MAAAETTDDSSGGTAIGAVLPGLDIIVDDLQRGQTDCETSAALQAFGNTSSLRATFNSHHEVSE